MYTIKYMGWVVFIYVYIVYIYISVVKRLKYVIEINRNNVIVNSRLIARNRD